MKKKFQLQELSVDSFVTELNDKESATVEGGTFSIVFSAIIGYSIKTIIDVHNIEAEQQARIKSLAMGRNCPIATIGGNCLTPTVTCTVTHVPNSQCQHPPTVTNP